MWASSREGVARRVLETAADVAEIHWLGDDELEQVLAAIEG